MIRLRQHLHKLRSPLARRLIVAIVLFSASITLITTAIELYIDYERGRAGIDARLDQIGIVHERALTQSVWATNRKEVQAQLEGIKRLPDITYVALYEDAKLSAEAGSPSTHRVMTRDYDLVYEHRGQPRVVGQLTVVATLDNLYRQLIEDVLHVLLGNFLRTLLVALFIFALFHRWITRHLSAITDHLRNLNPVAPNVPLALDRASPTKQDELDQLVDAANNMQGNIRGVLTALKDSEARVRLLLESTTEAIYGVDINGICTFANPACVRMLGYASENDLIGESIHELIHHTYPDGRAYPKALCAVRQASLRGEPCHCEDEVHWRADGTSFPVEYWAHPIYQHGELIGSVVNFVDISERKTAQEALLRFRSALDSSVDAIYIIDRKILRIVDANRAGWESLGYTKEDLLTLSPTEFEPEFTRDALTQEYARIVQDETHQGLIKTTHRRKNGSSFPVEVHVQPLICEKDKNSEYRYLVAVARDVTANRQAEEALHRLAYFDNLTGLPNRVLFNDRLRQAMADARRRGTHVALMLLDLDRFKVINDTMGHEAGDGLLREVAKRLRLSVREVDTVARLGGDEFALVFADVPDVKNVPHLAENILQRLNPPVDIGGREVFPSGSLGLALFPNDTEDFDSLMKFADSAMYHAKEAGRSNYQFYSQDMTAQAHLRLKLEGDMRRALERGEFFLHYQPQVAAVSGRITGVEALLRWNDAQGQPVPPASFIPVAEETGLIVPIGQWVLETACRQLKFWHESGFPELTVSVNVASRQFRDAQFVSHLTGVLDKTAIKPNTLELEITEGVLMDNNSMIRNAVSSLKALQVRLAIDDFGTGYSSLSYLKRFPIDRVKIDQSFVRDISHDRDDLAIVRAIIALARALKLKVIAEGVETRDQLIMLRAEQCEEYQGYYFARPMPANEVTKWLGAGELIPKVGKAGL